MRITLAISIFLSLMLHSLAHAADQRIAVLELRGAADGQVLRLMTDEVRGGVLQAVGDGEFIVMTRRIWPSSPRTWARISAA